MVNFWLFGKHDAYKKAPLFLWRRKEKDKGQNPLVWGNERSELMASCLLFWYHTCAVDEHDNDMDMGMKMDRF